MFLLFGRKLQSTLRDPDSQISRTLQVLQTADRRFRRRMVRSSNGLGMSQRGKADQDGRGYSGYTLPHHDFLLKPFSTEHAAYPYRDTEARALYGESSFSDVSASSQSV